MLLKIYYIHIFCVEFQFVPMICTHSFTTPDYHTTTYPAHQQPTHPPIPINAQLYKHPHTASDPPYILFYNARFNIEYTNFATHPSKLIDIHSTILHTI